MRNNPDNAPEIQAEYKAALESLADDALYKETKERIWLSAYAANNPISCYHWQCDATYLEWGRRGKGDMYGSAHAAVSRSV